MISIQNRLYRFFYPALLTHTVDRLGLTHTVDGLGLGLTHTVDGRDLSGDVGSGLGLGLTLL
jgi:hypothetical protein